MSTVYSSTGTQWPLLQSKTEQKFKSGLFNVSAEFIRPVGNTDLPSVIETSIGTVDVWPEPTVSTGTDGFERINATGYGVWDANLSDETYSYEIGIVYVLGSVSTTCTDPAGCVGGIPCGGQIFQRYLVKSFPAFFESVHIKKIGATFPQLVRPLCILNLAGENLTNNQYNITFFESTINPGSYSGDFSSKTISFATLPSMVKTNTYGTVKESEVVYGIRSSYNKNDTGLRADIVFGNFNRNPSPNWQGCNPV